MPTVNVTAALLTWLDNKHLQQLRIASALSSIASEYGDLGLAAEVLDKVSGMVEAQRKLVRWARLLAIQASNLAPSKLENPAVERSGLP